MNDFICNIEIDTTKDEEPNEPENGKGLIACFLDFPRSCKTDPSDQPDHVWVV